ncbi:MAG: hypothetical protein CM1200mP40_31040 [Gammaproteobacteria bacterium]|nr:MAG: hypothetical protein CM1200mP40_31040 [Gammaproteobacteria bacterium]
MHFKCLGPRPGYRRSRNESQNEQQALDTNLSSEELAAAENDELILGDEAEEQEGVQTRVSFQQKKFHRIWVFHFRLIFSVPVILEKE